MLKRHEKIYKLGILHNSKNPLQYKQKAENKEINDLCIWQK